MKSATVWKPQSGTGDTTSISTTFLTTQGGDFLITQGDDFLMLNPSFVTPKDDTIWGVTEIKSTTPWRVDGSGDVGNSASATRTTKLGDIRVTVSGDIRVTADGSYTPKDGTIWVEA